MCPSPFNILSVISIYIYLLNEWSENKNNNYNNLFFEATFKKAVMSLKKTMVVTRLRAGSHFDISISISRHTQKQ